MAKRIEYTMKITVMDLAGVHVIAFSNLGGILIKGRMGSDLGSAVRNLFTRLGHNPDDEALLAVDLFASKEDVSAVFESDAPALGDGNA